MNRQQHFSDIRCFSGMLLLAGTVALFSASVHAQDPRPDGPPVYYASLLQVDVYMKNVRSSDSGGGAEFYVHGGTININFEPGNSLPSASNVGVNDNINVPHRGTKKLFTEYLMLSDGENKNYKPGCDTVVVSIDGEIYEDDNSGDTALSSGRKSLRVPIPPKYRSKNRSINTAPGDKDFKVFFQNNDPRIVTCHWIDFEGKEIFRGQLAAGEKWEQQTYPGHLWRFRALTDVNNSGFDRSGEPIVTEVEIPAKRGATINVGDKIALSSTYDAIEIYVTLSEKQVVTTAAEAQNAWRVR